MGTFEHFSTCAFADDLGVDFLDDSEDEDFGKRYWVRDVSGWGKNVH